MDIEQEAFDAVKNLEKSLKFLITYQNDMLVDGNNPKKKVIDINQGKSKIAFRDVLKNNVTSIDFENLKADLERVKVIISGHKFINNYNNSNP